MGENIEKDIIMEKINIAEILKDCPKGMELDCTIFDDVYFDYIDDVSDIINCYIQDSTKKIGISFSKYGCYSSISKSKCVIFPKGKTTWEGFHSPFKDGDILINGLEDWEYNPFIFKQTNGFGNAQCYCAINCFEELILNSDNWTPIKGCRLATEEEKEKLFQAIKDNGYQWNAETKTLEKLPKFKVGYRIQWNGNAEIKTIIAIEEDRYRLNNGRYVKFGDEHCYKVLKFDISTLKPFESRVLVRDTNTQTWEGAFYSHYDVKDTHPYHCILFGRFKQCIPFEGNEHLLGKTDDCNEYYKTWE